MTRLLCASALLAGVSLPAFAERNTIDLLIGGYFPKVDTQTRLDSTELNEGTLIEFEDDLNLDDSKTCRWRLSRTTLAKKSVLNWPI